MRVNHEWPDLVSSYGKNGYCAPEQRLTDENVAKLRQAIAAISEQERPEIVYESGTSVIRAVHGCHRFDQVCDRVVRLPMLVDLAEALLGGPAYVYQFKVNMKQPREGAAWPWHQDFVFWHREDGMAAPDAVNIAVFLDDVTEANGPLRVIPGSHELGMIGPASSERQASHDWRKHVAAALEYTVPDELVESLVDAYGVVPLTGPAGAVTAFHPNIVHSSSNNTSEQRRAIMLVTYNRVSNAPANPTRPEFLVNRDTTPVVRIGSDDL
ncbi:phytanoyl-CoA dioxygenase family protein [Micromonospora tarensis]|uniref:Phytanoyl-CoA dioxygenase family protein n=1 Tax=Micromonospora tarensis TaxID=2806100 RepID=A0ABS1YA54_9ACTN|nr:phytanoyl-CoA dioxygenase family protein [Micromonospora tarensis]MBM0274278.1 phytanoyl-CoA dioxygenase family protein [Micromonospora tarensis]